MSKEQFHSRVYTDRPAYADFTAPEKFEAIKSIVAKRLVEHPNAICSYSGGSDSDIMLHLIEEVRHTFDLPPIKYCFFNTGLEMEAIKRHVRETAEKYGVDVLARLPMNPDFAAMCDEGKVMDIPNPGIDAEKLLDKAASVKVASSLMGGWTVAE